MWHDMFGVRRAQARRYHNLETAEAVANLLHGFRVYHPDDRTRRGVSEPEEKSSVAPEINTRNQPSFWSQKNETPEADCERKSGGAGTAVNPNRPRLSPTNPSPL